MIWKIVSIFVRIVIKECVKKKVSYICEKYRNEKYRDVENPFKFGTWWQEYKEGCSTPATHIVLSFNVLSCLVTRWQQFQGNDVEWCFCIFWAIEYLYLKVLVNFAGIYYQLYEGTYSYHYTMYVHGLCRVGLSRPSAQQYRTDSPGRWAGVQECGQHQDLAGKGP